MTSVPSDAPDDFAALRDLQSKVALREKYGITEEMCNFAPIEIISTPKYGNLSAIAACDEFKVRSQNDSILLAQAKDEVYLQGFSKGTMLVGPQAGQVIIIIIIIYI